MEIVNINDYRTAEKIKNIDFETKLDLYYKWIGYAQRDLRKIEILYNAINKAYFKNELPKIPLLITTTFNGIDGDTELNGCFYYDKDHAHHEHIILNMNTSAEAEDVLAHEMLHFYNHLHNIDDYDDKTREHKPAFYDQAKALGLPLGEKDILGIHLDKNFLNALMSEESVLKDVIRTLQKGATTQ